MNQLYRNVENVLVLTSAAFMKDRTKGVTDALEDVLRGARKTSAGKGPAWVQEVSGAIDEYARIEPIPMPLYGHQARAIARSAALAPDSEDVRYREWRRAQFDWLTAAVRHFHDVSRD